MKPTARTARISRYFHRGYLLSMTPPVYDAGRIMRPVGCISVGESDGLESAFRQGRGDGALLELQFDAVGNLDHDEVVGNLGHLAGDASRGNHLVALLQAG